MSKNDWLPERGPLADHRLWSAEAVRRGKEGVALRREIKRFADIADAIRS